MLMAVRTACIVSNAPFRFWVHCLNAPTIACLQRHTPLFIACLRARCSSSALILWISLSIWQSCLRACCTCSSSCSSSAASSTTTVRESESSLAAPKQQQTRNAKLTQPLPSVNHTHQSRTPPYNKSLSMTSHYRCLHSASQTAGTRSKQHPIQLAAASSFIFQTCQKNFL